MARGSTLEEIVALVRHEAGLGSNAASITDALPQIKHYVKRAQDDLYQEYDWPFLVVRNASKAMVAGQRYYDFPTTINPYRLFEVRRRWNSDDIPIQRGINWQEYSSLSSDADERQDPVISWDWYTNGSSTQFEVWPVPASADCTLYFTGMRPLGAFTADSDVADLDDYLIALRAARDLVDADTLKKMVAKEAERFRILKGNSKGGSPIRTLAGGTWREERPKGTIIRVSG